MNIKLPEIKQGMTLKCLNCGKSILLNDDRFTINEKGEFIKCPHCCFSYDIQSYHEFGEEIKN